MSLPYRIKSGDLRLLPSRYGLLFILILLSMLAGSINDNNNLGYLLTFLLSCMMVVSVLYTYRNMLGLELISVVTEPVFAGETATFRCILKPQNIERQLVRLHFHGEKSYLIEKATGKLFEFKIPHSTSQRGLLKTGPLYISSIYPFGLFKVSAKLNLSFNCIVYPSPLSHKQSENFIHESGADFEASSNGKGNDDFSGLDNYKEGDSLKHIYWKGIARGQGIKTKTFSGTSGSVMLLDYNELGNADHERKLSYLSDMTLEACRKQIPFSLKIPGRLIKSGQGETHLHKCLESLALC